MPARALYAWLILLGACSANTGAPRALPDADAEVEELPDSDRDGLCDFTEDDLGTNPDAADSDADGLPDFVELVNGFDPRDTVTPGRDQLAQLEARERGVTDFAIRATVDGDGQGLSGEFDALPSSYADELSAADFFTSAVAVSADPNDGARSIDEGSAYFGAVLGETRLAFSVRFEYPWAELGALDCARSYPFRYAIKSDDGETRAQRGYLLIVGPAGMSGADADHCIPALCQ